MSPHDLLWLANGAGLRQDGPLPDWATPEWLMRAPLVVRRDRFDPAGRIPVGLRGATRSRRFGGWLAPEAVLRRTTPEEVAHEAALQLCDERSSVPALQALAAIAPILDDSGLAWGPTGSAGFQLASGLPMLRMDSDLDLVVRAPVQLHAWQLSKLRALGDRAACRLDIQIDTGRGGFSLAEWLRNGTRVLLKTDRGPVLATDPWQTVPSRNAVST